ncbi:hypothetical protein ZEAMMB73_Zm00001d045949 [Zea mays]|uniref:Uncharacterized protein n=1 Tax=Zea mays TaxID=4577 RepID=A0A1D6P011_MAIZE|nr:hypothetical protein ZEAMMB73_Zm00001d045949 [Zea mays]AQL03491.1 hypothetical protein ZEAMMB73_Zm00001d045949 [Zea mays]
MAVVAHAGLPRPRLFLPFSFHGSPIYSSCLSLALPSVAVDYDHGNPWCRPDTPHNGASRGHHPSVSSGWPCVGRARSHEFLIKIRRMENQLEQLIIHNFWAKAFLATIEFPESKFGINRLTFVCLKIFGIGHDEPHVQIYQEPHCQSEAAYFHLSILQSVHYFHTTINKYPNLINQNAIIGLGEAEDRVGLLGTLATLPTH